MMPLMMMLRGRSHQWDEYTCPVHGLVFEYRVDDPEPPKVPALCPKKVRGRYKCGEILRFATTTRSEGD